MKLQAWLWRRFDGVEVGGRSGHDLPLMRRWRIISTDRLGIKVHHILRDDSTLDPPHDHPWSFVSIRLRRNYDDLRAGGVRRQRISFIRFDEPHKTINVPPDGVWTLVINGPRRHNWGFHGPEGFISADEYHEQLGLIGAHVLGARRGRSRPRPDPEARSSDAVDET